MHNVKAMLSQLGSDLALEYLEVGRQIDDLNNRHDIVALKLAIAEQGEDTVAIDALRAEHDEIDREREAFRPEVDSLNERIDTHLATSRPSASLFDILTQGPGGFAGASFVLIRA